MSFSIESYDGKSKLVYKLDANEAIDQLSLSMLKGKDIPHFLNLSFSQIDTDRFISYDITGQTSAFEVLKLKANFKIINLLFSGIIDALESCDQYMLLEGSILLNENYIYLDKDYKPRFVCLPVEKKDDEQEDIKIFFKKILINYNYSDIDNSDYFQKINVYLNNQNFSLEQFKKQLKQIEIETMGGKKQPVPPKPIIKQENKEVVVPKKEEKPIEKKENVAVPNVRSLDGAPLKPVNDLDENKNKKSLLWGQKNILNEGVKKVIKKKDEIVKEIDKNVNNGKFKVDFAIPGRDNSQLSKNKVEEQPKVVANVPLENKTNSIKEEVVKENVLKQKEELYKVLNAGNYEGTVVLDEEISDETTLLEQNDNPKKAYIIRSKNKRRALINKNRFIIGKDENNADFCISDNPTISRQHAVIVKENDNYFIIDGGSKNFSYINGKKLLSEEKAKLNNMDKIKLSNEEFVFIIE